MSKKKDPLKAFIPKRKPLQKSIYTMIKFNKLPSLLAYMIKRCDKLETTKQDYIVGLIRQDMEAQGEK